MALTGVEGGDVVRAVLDWTLPNVVTAQTRLAWLRTDSVGDVISFATMIGILDAKLTALADTVKSAQATVVNAGLFTGYTMIWVAGEWLAEAYMGQGLVDVDGTNATDMAPHGVAAICSYLTSVPKTRGKTYLPGFVDGAFDGSTLVASTLTTVEAWGTEYLATMVSGSYTFVPCLLSYKSATPVLFVSRAAGTFVGYQRRRGPGRGS